MCKLLQFYSHEQLTVIFSIVPQKYVFSQTAIHLIIVKKQQEPDTTFLLFMLYGTRVPVHPRIGDKLSP